MSTKLFVLSNLGRLSLNKYKIGIVTCSRQELIDQQKVTPDIKYFEKCHSADVLMHRLREFLIDPVEGLYNIRYDELERIIEEHSSTEPIEFNINHPVGLVGGPTTLMLELLENKPLSSNIRETVFYDLCSKQFKYLSAESLTISNILNQWFTESRKHLRYSLLKLVNCYVTLTYSELQDVTDGEMNVTNGIAIVDSHKCIITDSRTK